jgi:hypothetical protein
MVRLEAGGVSDQPAIEALLAIYNGERFLREQIDSILAQWIARCFVPVKS